MGVNFLIKHCSGGKYFHPQGGGANPRDETPIVLNETTHERMHWTFEKSHDQWGYIKHVKSGKCIHPQGGEINSGDNTKLILHEARHWGALFALDEYNDRIIHISGRYVHPDKFKPNPGSETFLILHANEGPDMNFKFVSTDDPKEEVLVYGKPTMAGKWKIIHLVLNPIAEHTEKIEITVGRSTTMGEKEGFKMKWEMSGELTLEKILSLKISESLEYIMERTSSATWSEQTKISREIRVQPGKPAVTWQYVFDIQHGHSKSIFHTNLLADTSSELEEPKDLQYKKKQTYRQ